MAVHNRHTVKVRPIDDKLQNKCSHPYLLLPRLQDNPVGQELQDLKCSLNDSHFTAGKESFTYRQLNYITSEATSV